MSYKLNKNFPNWSKTDCEKKQDRFTQIRFFLFLFFPNSDLVDTKLKAQKKLSLQVVTQLPPVSHQFQLISSNQKESEFVRAWLQNWPQNNDFSKWFCILNELRLFCCCYNSDKRRVRLFLLIWRPCLKPFALSIGQLWWWLFYLEREIEAKNWFEFYYWLFFGLVFDEFFLGT